MENSNGRNGGTGSVRPEFTQIASDILDEIGTIAGPDDAISRPRWRIEELLAEAAARGADLGNSADELQSLKSKIADIHLKLCRVHAQTLIFANARVDGIGDGEMLQIGLEGMADLIADIIVLADNDTPTAP